MIGVSAELLCRPQSFCERELNWIVQVADFGRVDEIAITSRVFLYGPPPGGTSGKSTAGDGCARSLMAGCRPVPGK